MELLNTIQGEGKESLLEVVNDHWEMSGVYISSGSSFDILTIPMPGEERAFSYYIERILASKHPETIPFAEPDVSTAGFRQALANQRLSAGLVVIKLMNPGDMRDVLEKVLNIAYGEEIDEDLEFYEGHWDYKVDKNGDWTNDNATSSVTVSDVLDHFSHMIRVHREGGMGNIKLTQILQSTAYREYDMQLVSLSSSPDVAVLGHPMDDVHEECCGSMYLVRPGAWYEKATAGKAKKKSLTSRTLADIFVGTTSTGLSRPMRVEIHHYASAGSSMWGHPWTRERLDSEIWIGLSLILFVTLVLIAVGVYVAIKWTRKQKEGQDEDDLKEPLYHMELGERSLSSISAKDQQITSLSISPQMYVYRNLNSSEDDLGV
eukprot:GHVO01010837.1.p1 GENE.GHVO01010837.1~~GHVO01010837.1.p1  ORF type:complete len:375 (+),score=62.44 GHVO01010837.1:187-1311(+)